MATRDRLLRRSRRQPVEHSLRTAKAPVPARRLPPKIRRFIRAFTPSPPRGYSRLPVPGRERPARLWMCPGSLRDHRRVQRDGREPYRAPARRLASNPCTRHLKGSPKPGCTLKGSRSDSRSRSENLGLSAGCGGIVTRQVQSRWDRCVGAKERRRPRRCPRSTLLLGKRDRGASRLRDKAFSAVRCRGSVPVFLRVPVQSGPSMSARPNSRCLAPTTNRTSPDQTEPADRRAEISNGQARRPPVAGYESTCRAVR